MLSIAIGEEDKEKHFAKGLGRLRKAGYLRTDKH